MATIIFCSGGGGGACVAMIDRLLAARWGMRWIELSTRDELGWLLLLLLFLSEVKWSTLLQRLKATLLFVLDHSR